MWEKLAEDVRVAVFYAIKSAGLSGDLEIDPGHLLMGLLSVPECTACKILAEQGLDPATLKDRISKSPVGPETEATRVNLAQSGKRAIDLAAQEARNMGLKVVGTEHLLLGLAQGSGNEVAVFLRDSGLDLRCRRQIRGIHESRKEG
jgi:ATP-dependent Clp protease ATP-binding subunit ClpC